MGVIHRDVKPQNILITKDDQVLTHDPPDPRALRPHVTRDLAVVCAKALEKPRDRRYQRMAELAEDLRACAPGEAGGTRLFFRAKEEVTAPAEPRVWIGIAHWPLANGAVELILAPGPFINFPHASDAGDRVVWCEWIEGDEFRVLGARVAGSALEGARGERLGRGRRTYAKVS